MTVPDSAFSSNFQHKLLTVYTDSAPNSLSDLNWHNLPNAVVDFEHEGASNWTSSSETVGNSFVTFEVSETETCASNLSDDFHMLTEYPLQNEVYIPISFPNSSTSYTDQNNINSYGDCVPQTLVWPSEEAIHVSGSIMPEVINESNFLPNLHIDFEEGSTFEKDAYIPVPACSDVPKTPQLAYRPEHENSTVSNVQPSFEYPQEVLVDNVAQSFASQLEVNPDLTRTNDCNGEPKNGMLTWHDSSTENYPDFYVDSSVCIHTVQAYDTNGQSYTGGYSVCPAQIDSYEIVGQTTECSNYDFVPINPHGYSCYNPSEATYYKSFPEGLSNAVVYSECPPILENQNPECYGDATIFVSNFPNSLIAQDNTQVAAYLIPENAHDSCLKQADVYSAPVVHVPFSTNYEIKDVGSFRCTDSMQCTQALDLPLASIITDGEQQLHTVSDVYSPTVVYACNNTGHEALPHDAEYQNAENVSNNCIPVDTPVIQPKDNKISEKLKWNCSHCPLAFQRQSHLVEHLRTHTGERPFKCVLCGRKFTQASNLRRHLSSHKAWPPASSCTVSLISKTSHNSQVTNNPSAPRALPHKVWICRFCDQRFDSYLQLRVHMVHHKDKQVYSCVFNGCESSFASPNNLLNHLVEKHQFYKEDGLSCETCGQKYSDFGHLVRHLLPRRNGSNSGCPTLSFHPKRKKRKLRLTQPKSTWQYTTTHSQNEELTSKLSTECSRSVNVMDSKFNLLPLQALKTSDSSFGYKCPFCIIICQSLKHLRVHLSRKHSSLFNVTTDSKSSLSKSTNDEICSSSSQISSFSSSSTSSSHNVDQSNSNSSVSSSRETALFLLQLEKCLLSKDDQQTFSKNRPPKVFVCKFCGKHFQKPKFFNDHELMCQQSIEERARRNRLRANKREKFIVTQETVVVNTNNPSNTEAVSSNNELISSDQSDASLRRSTRNRTFQAYWKPKSTRRKPKVQFAFIYFHFFRLKASSLNSQLPRLSVQASSALQFDILHECAQTRARRCQLWLPHCPNGPVETPVFMPVGTQGSMKGITVEQLQKLDCRILLGNTYHLGHRPGPEILRKAGGLHKFMSWPRAILTDSGGFQMVSLNSLSKVTEDGVLFTSPHNGTEMLLTPEESVGNLQNALGSDIVMQLDHVVHVLTDKETMKEAMERSIRWLDRCIDAHQNQQDKQNLFAITQGGLDPSMRIYCINEMLKRKDKIAGYAIGGLSGGEAKDDFWRIVKLSTEHLPRDRPRYVMGVGFPVDLVVCIALGCDMFDCVYPTRTGRFGNALVPWGQLNLRHAVYASDFRPIDENCPCPTCTRPLSRAWIHSALSGRQVNASAVVSLHNLAYMLGLMKKCREAISENTFPQFVRSFFERRCYMARGDQNPSEYEGCRPPSWACDALQSVNIDISDIGQSMNGFHNSLNSDNEELKSKRSRNSSVNCEVD
uniref:Queuine tRNA-ribosyltransferase catalytic subunit 1 n=1 Tax=Trichobilharzia regenti TaxID=157069 RepID=A0AA85JEJ3_TRIRE|nr:unnamed protein product [Trichobilharzia regenti]